MRILNTFPIFRRYEAVMRAHLPPGCTLHFVSQENESGLLEVLPQADVLICNRFTAEYAARSRRLRLLHTPGAGLDKVDLEAIPPGVRLCQSFGHGASIAEHVIMVSIAMLRRLFVMDRNLREGNWLAPQFNPDAGPLEPLAGKTAAILGTGEIGKAVAGKFRAFGVHTVGINRKGRSAAGFDETHPVSGLLRVLPQADLVVIGVPLDRATRGLIGEAELSALKSPAYLVNVARGPVVDEEALFRALSSGRLTAAAIDVWYDYPPPGGGRRQPSRLPFAELDNVIMTPHASGVAKTTFDKRIEDLLFNIEALSAGRPLRHEVRLPGANT